MRFQQDFIDKVIEANDIVSIISQYTTLKPSGSNLMGLCPFPSHNEKSPSFSVSPTKQLYHCFGCKKGGNITHFLQDYQGLSFPEAIEYLATKASIPLPVNEVSMKEVDEERKKTKTLEKVNQISFEFFESLYEKLPKEHPAKTYVASRGLSEETCKLFHISYAPEAWEELSLHLSRKGAPLSQAALLGLIKKKKNQNAYFDIFRNRLLFPIFTPMGKVVGFGGRVLSKEDQPKYLNSPESPIFHKGKMLYGLDETAKFIRSEDEVIVVEGYMDLVSLYQHGMKNLAANLGTAFTPDQARLLKKYSKNVVMLFDGDAAGQGAMKRSLPILLREGLSPRGLSLPNGMDPDDYVRQYGVDKLKELVAKSQDLFLWFLHTCLKSFQGKPAEKLAILDESFPILTEIKDFRLIKLYLAEMAYLLDVEVAWLEASYGRFRKEKSEEKGSDSVNVVDSAPRSKQGISNNTNENNKLDLSAVIPEELELMNLILAKKRLLENMLEPKLQEIFVSEMGKKILSLVISEYRQNSGEFARLGSSVLKKVLQPELLTKHMDEKLYEDEDKSKKLFELCIQKLKKIQMRDRLNKVKAELKYSTSQDSLENLRDIILATKNKSREEINE